MAKKLHTTGSHRFLKKLLMVRAVFPDEKQYRDTLSYVRKTITTTWGYTKTLYEYSEKADTYVTSVSYWCFSDKQDLLQFTLFTPATVKSVTIWPSKLEFTVTEYVDE